MKSDNKKLVVRDTILSGVLLQAVIVIATISVIYLFGIRTSITDNIGGLVAGLLMFAALFLVYIFYKSMSGTSFILKLIVLCVLLIASSFSYGIGTLVPLGVPHHKVVGSERDRKQDNDLLTVHITTNVDNEKELLKIIDYRVRTNKNDNRRIRMLFYRPGDSLNNGYTVGVAIAIDGKLTNYSMSTKEETDALK